MTDRWRYFEFQLLLEEAQRPWIDVLVADFLIGINFDRVIHQLIDFILQRDDDGRRVASLDARPWFEPGRRRRHRRRRR